MKFYLVRQELVSRPIKHVATEVRNQLDTLDLDVPQDTVAITVGSRGISQIPLIIKTAGEWLREHGAKPFIVPCMGSHNGATAKGQQELVELLGMSEPAMGMPIRSRMECVKLASVSTGDVWMDRNCYEAGATLVINRIKLHTCFSGPIQSGLVKMMVVGMGKIQSAQTFHSCPTPQMKDMLIEMGQVIIDSGRILAGLALLEDGYEEIAEIHSVQAPYIILKEPELLLRYQEYFPRIPVDDLNVLIIDSIGKTYSGTGMDTNVIGYRGIKGFEDLERPRINIIAALSMSEDSRGNAVGVGLADFITKSLRDAIDEEKTFLNGYTTGDMQRVKIPATLQDDETLFEKIFARFGQQRTMLIQNTLRLSRLYISSDLLDEVNANPLCRIDPYPIQLNFKDRQLDRQQLWHTSQS